MTDLFLIQPLSGDLPFIVPTGSIALFNLLDLPKRGVFEFELTTELIREIKVAAIPLQWAYSLPSAISLAKRIKTINPSASLIGGGYMADLYGSVLLDAAPFDALIVGDAERPFPALVKMLLAGEVPHNLPGVITRQGPDTTRQVVNQQEFDMLNGLDISWFPTLSKIAHKTQVQSVPTFIYPWLEFTRGCCFACPDCLGSKVNQHILADRGLPIIRSHQSAREMLTQVEQANLNWCYFTSDFVAVAGIDWARKALKRNSALTAYFESYDLPSSEKVDLLTDSFRGGVLSIFLDLCQEQGRSDDPGSWQRLGEIAARLKGGWKLLIYLNDNSKGSPPARIRRVSWFKFFRSSEVEAIVPDGLPPLDVLLGQLEKGAGRLVWQNRILAFILLRMGWLFPILWKVSGWLALLRRK